MIEFERLWTGRSARADVCDPCQVLVLPNDVRTILTDGRLLVTLCPACHVRRLPAPSSGRVARQEGVRRG